MVGCVFFFLVVLQPSICVFLLVTFISLQAVACSPVLSTDHQQRLRSDEVHKSDSCVMSPDALHLRSNGQRR